jgi:hypothetical protein
MFGEGSQAMEKRGLKVNMDKTKLMITGKKIEENLQVGRYPCGVCGRSVGVNSILCMVCAKWCHKKCFDLRNLNRVVNFSSPACEGRRTYGGV